MLTLLVSNYDFLTYFWKCSFISSSYIISCLIIPRIHYTQNAVWKCEQETMAFSWKPSRCIWSASAVIHLPSNLSTPVSCLQCLSLLFLYCLQSSYRYGLFHVQIHRDLVGNGAEMDGFFIDVYKKLEKLFRKLTLMQ